MDHMMPGMDGIETMKAIRATGYTEPIVALTATALIGKAEEFIKIGFDGFISKPIRTKHLNTVLTKHIKDKQPTSVLEAVKPVSKPAEDIGSYQTSPDLMKKLRSDFIKNHKNKHSEIIAAINAGDNEKARLLAHSLKGVAGLIGETTLASAAEKAEKQLAAGVIPMLDNLEKELNHVLDGIEITETHVLDDKNFEKGNAVELFQKLKPLLKRRNNECLDLLDELRVIPKTETLVKQIEDYDFAAALETLDTLFGEN
jgi:HPt (histidine-containing phosphotransfer) domain-containing protein